MTKLYRDLPRGLGAHMQGGRTTSTKVARRAHDFYPTPPPATRALIAAERPYLDQGRPVWEPCGRGGAIVQELRACGFDTVASDIVPDLDHQVQEADLLGVRVPMATQVITNPPFALAARMIAHLMDTLTVDYLALLLKATYWHAAERRALFERHRPARLYALGWRLDFTGGGASTMDCAWNVWDRASAGEGTDYRLMAKPGQDTVPDLFTA